ncbi:MAG: SDR family NAD(P)-dependent oxidoreductase [Steroidobacteraceae bacterium]|jgi:NAD(P)-dependent dehydrogenase (short-subunit alcohol dehydrogenase family)|nr:SDR family NAD(P)-dependent oxidoreductase [Steroidobacteraceae bacterium]
MELGSAQAVVTGAASGLGLALARRIVAAGGKATLLDLQQEAGQAAAAGLGPSAHFIRCDVTEEAAVEAAVREGQARMGGLTLAVACAGIGTPGKLLGRDGPMSAAFFQRILSVNVGGTFNLGRAAAALMQHNAPDAGGERGLIVHTASVAAWEGQVGQVAYSASKAAVVGMVLPMARELARFGIRVMAVAPGLFATPMLAGLPQEVQDSLGAQVPFPSRLGQPDEFADLVAAIYANPMLNGSAIRLDGAIRMQPR